MEGCCSQTRRRHRGGGQMCSAHEEQTMPQEPKPNPKLKKTHAPFPGVRDGPCPTLYFPQEAALPQGDACKGIKCIWKHFKFQIKDIREREKNKITHCQLNLRHEIGISDYCNKWHSKKCSPVLGKDINVTATTIKLYMRDCNLYSQFIACNVHLDLLES